MKHNSQGQVIMNRLQTNKNLTVFNELHFRGLPVMQEKGPLILEYLERLHDVIQWTAECYPRIFAVRFDLRFPQGYMNHDEDMDSRVIGRFIASLRAKVKHNRLCASRTNNRVHDTIIRYVWAKEYGDQEGRPHYHFLILVNRDAFHTLGHFTSEFENLYSRVQSAWASALGLSWEASLGLVHIPKNPTYHVKTGNLKFALAELFYRASYLCKVRTKRFGGWRHAFGSSRH